MEEQDLTSVSVSLERDMHLNKHQLDICVLYYIEASCTPQKQPTTWWVVKKNTDVKLFVAQYDKCLTRAACVSKCSTVKSDLTNARDGVIELPPPRGGTPYSGLYGEAPPERGTFFRLEVYKRVGISRVEVYKKAGKTDI